MTDNDMPSAPLPKSARDTAFNRVLALVGSHQRSGALDYEQTIELFDAITNYGAAAAADSRTSAFDMIRPRSART